MLPFGPVKGIMLKESCLFAPSANLLQIQLWKPKYGNFCSLLQPMPSLFTFQGKWDVDQPGACPQCFVQSFLLHLDSPCNYGKNHLFNTGWLK